VRKIDALSGRHIEMARLVDSASRLVQATGWVDDPLRKWPPEVCVREHYEGEGIYNHWLDVRFVGWLSKARATVTPNIKSLICEKGVRARRTGHQAALKVECGGRIAARLTTCYRIDGLSAPVATAGARTPEEIC
jgi:hypothetical protein